MRTYVATLSLLVLVAGPVLAGAATSHAGTALRLRTSIADPAAFGRSAPLTHPGLVRTSTGGGDYESSDAMRSGFIGSHITAARQQTAMLAEGASAAQSCPLRIAALAPRASPQDRRGIVGTDFAVLLATDGAAHAVSGTLWIVASAHAYRVAFNARQALGNDLSGTNDPISFHLPASARFEEAFVDEYQDGDTLRTCAIAGDWAGSMTLALSDQLLSLIASPTATDAIPAEPIAEPDLLCEHRSARRTTISAHTPTTPKSAARQHLHGNVDVSFDLDAASIPANWTITASPDAVFDPVALDAAKKSVFRTEIENCRALPETVTFRVMFR